MQTALLGWPTSPSDSQWLCVYYRALIFDDSAVIVPAAAAEVFSLPACRSVCPSHC